MTQHGICKICNKSFEYKLRKGKDRKVCSKACRSISNKLNCKGISKKSTICIRCKKEFIYRVNGKLIRKYCTRLCKDLDSRTRIEISCKSCGKYIYRKPSGMYLTCSIKCRDVLKVQNNPLAFYKNATKNQKLNKLKELYNKHIIKKDGCWDWKAYKDKLGYGFFTFNKKLLSIHRASWIIHHGEIPKGLWILHHCDNPSCSNPDHLYIGNAKDNRKDCIYRNRANVPKGEKHPGAKLKTEDIIKIRKLLSEGNLLHREIAEKFNISKSIISSIKRNIAWRHIENEK